MRQASKIAFSCSSLGAPRTRYKRRLRDVDAVALELVKTGRARRRSISSYGETSPSSQYLTVK